MKIYAVEWVTDGGGARRREGFSRLSAAIERLEQLRGWLVASIEAGRVHKELEALGIRSLLEGVFAELALYEPDDTKQTMLRVFNEGFDAWRRPLRRLERFADGDVEIVEETPRKRGKVGAA